MSLNNIYYTFKDGKLWKHNSDSVNRNTFYAASAAESYIEPILNDNPSTIKTFNNISYEGTSGWELDFMQTDISSVGSEPALEDFSLLTLQLTGAADNSIISGEQSVYAKNGESVQWIITAKPKNSDYEFENVNDVILTGSGISIQNPSTITNNSLVFLVTASASANNEIKTVAISGTGASLIFEVSLLTVSIGDSVTSGAVSPALVNYTTSGANNLVVTVSPISTHYVDPGNIVANTSGLSTLQPISASTITRNVIVRNYGSNAYAIDDPANSIDYIKQPILILTKGKTYIFDQSDSSNTGHPIKFSTTSNGTHGGGTEYTTGVTYNGTPGSAGAYTQIVITATTPTLYYYCSNHGGMGDGANITDFVLGYNNGDVLATFPLLVPTSATNNSLGISGSATTLPLITWATPSSGVLTTPVGTSTGNAYSNSPYSAASSRTATLRWTASGTDKVLLPNSHSLTYDVPGYSISSTTLDGTSQEYLENVIVLPPQTSDITATATITGSGEVTASVGTYVSSIAFSASGNTNTSITNSNGATVPIQITADEPWVLLNGTPGTKVVDPDGINFLGSNYPFTINVDDNGTGSSRTAQIEIEKFGNARVTGSATANQTISITQSA